MDDDDDDEDEVLCRPVPSAAAAKKSKSARGGGWMRYLRATSLLSAWEMPIFIVALTYVAICPYNKVEESFGLQATHDLIFHQADIDEYDHHEYPGVVPRTFLGPILLALLSSPFVGALNLAGQPKIQALHAVRATLACASCACLIFVMRAVRRHYGRDTFRALVLLSLTQFHWLFYCSRTLPNTFASLLVLLATGTWVDGRPTPTIRLLTVAVVIFRAELVLLLGPLALLLLLNRQISFTQLVWAGLSAALPALAATVAVDSIFWRRTIYPEGEVLFFNTVLNKSSEYGTAPSHWYFSSALPRCLLAAYPLALLSLRTVPRARSLVGVPLLFVALYSALPHKELRFVLYAVPPLNIAAAAAAAKLWNSLPSRKEKSFLKRQLGMCGSMALLTVVQISVVASGAFLAASYSNYPGGRALERVHALGERSGAARGNRPIHVHVGVDAAMSGVSRFLERGHPWRYSKKETLKPHEYSRFQYALVGPSAEIQGFSQVHVEEGFDRIIPKPPFFQYGPKIKVLRRKKEGAGAAASAGAGGAASKSGEEDETFFGDI